MKKTAISRPGKVLQKQINPQSFGKVMEICFTISVYLNLF